MAKQKKLINTRRASATMYAGDLAEYSSVVLTTSEMKFLLGWLRMSLILFGQLAGISGNRPEALVDLRYRHLMLTLIRDTDDGRPRLLIELTPEFTKGFLGMKDSFVTFLSLSFGMLTLVVTHSQSQRLSLTRHLYSALTPSFWGCFSRSRHSSLVVSLLQRSCIA